LPRIIVKEVLDQAVQDVLDSDNYKSDPIWGNAPIIPVEFAGAAYRFGHTLTRSHYHINANRLNVDLFENFKDKPGNALSVFNAVAPENIVDWRFFFEVDSSIEPQKARKIDTWMAHEFYDLPFVPKAAKDRGENSLAFRNLLRGAVSYSLPSGEEVAKAFGVNPIPLHPKVKAAGLTETPFWFYCLAEAEAHSGKLGPVGGRIVAMTLLRIIKEDPDSYVNAPKPWKPYLGEGDDFTMADLVKFVQKHYKGHPSTEPGTSVSLDQRAGIIEPLKADRGSNNWHQVKFEPPFPQGKKVVVVPMTQTYTGTETPGLRIRNVNHEGFEIRFDEVVLFGGKSSDGNHVNETVGWIAVVPFNSASHEEKSTGSGGAYT